MVSSSTKRANRRAEMEAWFRSNHHLRKRGSLIDAEGVVEPFERLFQNFEGEASEFDIELVAKRLDRLGQWIPDDSDEPAGQPKSLSPSKVKIDNFLFDNACLERAVDVFSDPTLELVFGDDEEKVARQNAMKALDKVAAILSADDRTSHPLLGHNGPPPDARASADYVSGIDRLAQMVGALRGELSRTQADMRLVVAEARAMRDWATEQRTDPGTLQRAANNFMDAYSSKLGDYGAMATIGALVALVPAIQNFIRMLVLWLFAVVPGLMDL